MKRILFTLLCLFGIMLTKAQNPYDFVVPNSDGIRMYYKITDPANNYVMLTKPEGEADVYPTIDPYYEQMYSLGITRFKVPAKVTHGGNTYDVKIIGSNTNTLGGGKEIILPEGLTTLKDRALWGISIKSINFPSTLEYIGSEMFYYTSFGLTTPLIFDLSQTKITSLINAFTGGVPGNDDDSNITKLLFPETLRTLRRLPRTLTGLTELTIPSAVTSMNDIELLNLSSLYMKGSTPPASSNGELIFPNTIKIYVPTETTTSYAVAPGWSSFAGNLYEELNIGSTGYTTYYLETENFKVPTGCTAYLITGTKTGSTAPVEARLIALPAGSIIPKQTGFILEGTPGKIAYRAAVTGTEADNSTNLMIGTSTEQEFSGTGYKYYVLANGPKGIGFYHQGTRDGESIKLKAHQAGLRLSNLGPAPAKAFILDFEQAKRDLTTGIRSVETTQLQPETIYDLQGRRVTQPTKGIYIVNGKKKVFN